LGRGLCPSPNPSPLGRGIPLPSGGGEYPLPRPHPFGAFGASIIAPLALGVPRSFSFTTRTLQLNVDYLSIYKTELGFVAIIVTTNDVTPYVFYNSKAWADLLLTPPAKFERLRNRSGLSVCLSAVLLQNTQPISVKFNDVIAPSLLVVIRLLMRTPYHFSIPLIVQNREF